MRKVNNLFVFFKQIIVTIICLATIFVALFIFASVASYGLSKNEIRRITEEGYLYGWTSERTDEIRFINSDLKRSDNPIIRYMACNGGAVIGIITMTFTPIIIGFSFAIIKWIVKEDIRHWKICLRRLRRKWRRR